MEPPFKMEAGAATAIANTGADSSRTSSIVSRAPAPGPRPVPSPEDPFRLGFRYRSTTLADGRKTLEQAPLSYEDLVYPQEGDHVSQGLPHYSFLHPRADALRRHLEKRPNLTVTSDVLLVLRHDGKTSAPDIAVIRGDLDISGIERSIPLLQQDARLVFVLEAVSTSSDEIEHKDLETNKKRYASEGVEEYFTVYPQGGARVSKLVGRRLDPSATSPYIVLPANAAGRVHSKRTGLYFSIDPVSQELVMEDAVTGQRLRTSDEEEAGRIEAEAGRAEAERRVAEESKARRRAEAARRQEAEARQQEAEARRRAEEARQQAEVEIERLKALLRG